MDKLRLGIDVFVRDLGDKVVSTNFMTQGVPAIEGFEIYGEDTYRLHSNRLYLCLDDRLPPCKHIEHGTGIIIFEGHHHCTDQACARCDIITVHNIESRKLINEVAAILERYNNLERAILTSANDASLPFLMEQAELLVGCPVCIMDANLDIIASSTNKEPMGNPLWESILNNEKPMRCELVDHLVGMPMKEDEAPADASIRQLSLAGWNMLTCNVVVRGYPVASLWAFQTKPHRDFGKAEKSLFAWLSRCIRSWAERTKLLKASRGRQTERFLLDLVDGVWEDDATILDAAHMVGATVADAPEHVLLVLRMTQAASPAGRCVEILDMLEDACPDLVCAVHDTAIIDLMGTEENGYLSDKLLKTLDTLSRDQQCVTFVSTPYKHLKDSSQVLRQLLECFKFLDNPSEDYGLHEYCDYALQQSMHLIVDMQPQETMIHPMIRKLLAYDLANNTDYLDTFKVYLNNRCNMTDTAKQLYMHRNTLLHRIKRVEELLGGSSVEDWGLRRRLLFSIDYLNLNDLERF